MRYKTSPLRSVALEQHSANTPLARRMVEGLGQEGFQIAKAMQSMFNAKVVHYRDQHGEVGTDPRWPV